MAHIVDRNLQRMGVDLIHDPVVPNPEPVQAFSTLHFARVCGKWIVFQMFYAINNAGDDMLRKPGKILFDRWLEG